MKGAGMRAIYFVETNLICVIMIILLMFNTSRIKEKQLDQHYYFLLQIWTIILCMSDLFAGVYRGETFAGARIVLWASNIIYCIAITTISYLWMVYELSRLYKNNIRFKRIYIIPAIVMGLLIATTPLHGLAFAINEMNLYVRGKLLWLHWIVNWTYFTIPTVVIVKQIMMSRNKIYRSELYPMLWFISFPAAASIIQMTFYGTTVIQIGITASMLMIGLRQQNAQISLDELTGLNNRGHLNKYLASKFYDKQTERWIYCIMIDINFFKKINDTYGHITGDQAIMEVAELLKKVCGQMNEHAFVARYGGDEFVVIGYDIAPGSAIEMVKRIQSELKCHGERGDAPYKLSLSIGYEEGRMIGYSSPDELLDKADNAMYAAKNEFKKSSGMDTR